LQSIQQQSTTSTNQYHPNFSFDVSQLWGQVTGRLHRTFQLLSVHPFEKVPTHELLTEEDLKSYMPHKNNQLMLLDL
jgi:hypothetical protein